MIAICQDGLGGCLSAISFAELYERKVIGSGRYHLYFICNKEVRAALEPIISYFGWDGYFFEDNIKDIDLAAKLKEIHEGEEDIYILTPDYFGTVAGYSIDDAGITWSQILENRFLDFNFIPKENSVLLAIHTAQENNSYPFLGTLISVLCEQNPECKFWFPDIKIWGDKKIEVDIKLTDFAAKYKNFNIYIPKSLADDLQWIKSNIKYFIGVDNGIMNYAYVLGRERIMLDSRWGNRAFEMRWRHQGFKDSVPINYNPQSIGEILNLLIKNPELSQMNKINICSGLFDFIGYKTKTKLNE